MENEKEREPKTLFEHMGFDGSKLAPYKAKIKQIAILMLIGYIGGLIVDITLDTAIFQSILPLGIALMILLKVYASEQNKQN